MVEIVRKRRRRMKAKACLECGRVVHWASRLCMDCHLPPLPSGPLKRSTSVGQQPAIVPTCVCAVCLQQAIQQEGQT